MGYCARKPFAGPNVWLEQKVIQRYTPEGVQVDIRDPATAFGCRNQAVILLLLDTRLLASELLQLTVADIQWHERRIHIRWARGQNSVWHRSVNGRRRRSATTSAASRGEVPGCVFLASRGPRVPLAPFSLMTLFDRLGHRADVRHVHADRFRRTLATWPIENLARELDRPRDDRERVRSAVASGAATFRTSLADKTVSWPDLQVAVATALKGTAP